MGDNVTTLPRESQTGRSASEAAEEVLYHTGRTRVLRLTLTNGSRVIVKEPRGPRASERLRHENMILKRLAGTDAVPRISPDISRAGAIVLEDAGGQPLSAMVPGKPLDVTDLVVLAGALSRAVSQLHRNGVIHRDVNPANIIILGGRPELVQLIDFDLATTFAEDRPGFTHENRVAGTLPYLAPEQTGRTGRAVDHRADLYGIGATLFTLAVGEPPFGDSDREPLDLIHAHLTRAPRKPSEVNPAVPAALSDIILRLLKKEPDKRYQSADGLAHDLSRLVPDADGRYPTFPLAERDFPMQLAAPSRLVGRDDEIRLLSDAFTGVAAGERRTVLVSGVPGVGKTALIDELRPLVTAAAGWFVTGKFDQYRRDSESDGVQQSLRGMGRLLLAEPDEQLAVHRMRIREALGANTSLIAHLLPEFATLLDIAPDEQALDDAADADSRIIAAEIDLLRTIASPARPVVIVLDDLQWAGSTAIGLLDRVVMDDQLAGVLVVGAYRDAEVDAAHPLAPRMQRWERTARPVVTLRLRNLAPTDLGALVASILRMDRDAVGGLLDAVVERTGGNPYDTVEMLNWLRREGALTPAGGGWQWDSGLVRGYLGRGDVIDVLRSRMEQLPPSTRPLMSIMACLGGSVPLNLLFAADSADAGTVEQALAPALEEGLLVTDRSGEPSIRFRHDRVQQAAYEGLTPDDRVATHLLLARRLAGHGSLTGMAAEQYLAAIEAVTEPEERLRAAKLFRETAAGVGLSNPAAADRFLAAAIGLLTDDQDHTLLVQLHIDRHAALIRLGRLDTSDEMYAEIERLSPRLLDRIEASCLQISSLGNRNHFLKALDLGLAQLRELGCEVPADEAIGAGIGERLGALYAWVERDGLTDATVRPGVTDAAQVAIAKLINRSLPSAFFTGRPIMAWLALEAWQRWIDLGPCAPLMGPISHLAFVTKVAAGDHRTGYRVLRWILAAGESLGYELPTSQSRFLFALSSGHWFDPLPDNVAESHRAHEELQRHGDLHNAAFTYYTSTVQLLACAPTVDNFRADADAGVAFGVRCSNDQAIDAYLGYRQMGRALCGETGGAGQFDDADYTETSHLARLATNPTAGANFHAVRALTALVFRDDATMSTNAAAAAGLLQFVPSTYAELYARLVRMIDLARTHADDAELDAHRQWLADRAAEAPHNFQHLLTWVDAERSAGDVEPWTTIIAFDRAINEARTVRQPLFTALITERAGLVNHQRGLHHAGRQLIGEARRRYDGWGAVAKVRELDREYGVPQEVTEFRSATATVGRSATTSMTGDAIDLLGVLRASQTLSSETNVHLLRGQVASTLSAMTGADSVQLLIRNTDTGEWTLSSDERIALADAERLGLVPGTAFRYAERTRGPLLVDDATVDGRFARDPYFQGSETCSLMVVPVLARGILRAMVILANRQSHGTFSPQRLDAVNLVAGQLAVSLDNALLYASLEAKVAERTEALESANRQLERLSATDALTGLSNRRDLEASLMVEWQRAVREQRPLSVVMIDVDHFKLYNDRYGHAAGDRCLRSVASVLNHQVRGTDTVARYGGEEFTIILPTADLADAVQTAERVRTGVSALNEPHEGSPLGTVSISLGVASTVPTPETTPQQLLAEADAHLYEAKHGGRNRVMPVPGAAEQCQPVEVPAG
ncbi:diguanylate cyclase [Actinoplanes sp. NBRC 103695]|uniref:diguanylate cyclase n=1 Tax=Actinoplanes sp. NBRC 103695 TaxID=3032202 RepID=UPI00255319FA|nr:diguanylate cyclase [Actinoplanes sp. NBRC 103695]